MPPRPDSCGQGLLFCSAGQVRVLEVGVNAVDLVLVHSPACISAFTEGIPLSLPCLSSHCP